MNLVDFLELDPNKEYEIHYDGEFIWKHTHFQYKRKNEIGELIHEIEDPNSLPLLDEKYIIGDAGELLLNDNDEAVFDPTQEIGEQRYLGIGFEQIYKSKTFVPLLQKKIKELIDSGRLTFFNEGDTVTSFSGESYTLTGPEILPIDEWEIYLEDMGCRPGWSFLDDLFYSIGCNDIKTVKEKEDDSILWFNSTEMDEETGDWFVCPIEAEENNKKESLDGKSIVISGVFEKYSRKELKAIIENGGGKNASSISKNTSFILAGDKMGPSKKEKAIELNIEMIGEEEFIKKYIN